MKTITDNNWLYFNYKNNVEQTMFNFTHDLFYSTLVESYKWDSIIDLQIVCQSRENGSILIKPSGCGTWFIYGDNPTDWILEQIQHGNITGMKNIGELLVFKVVVTNPDVKSDFDVTVLPTLLGFNPETQNFEPVTELEYSSVTGHTYNKRIDTKEGN